MLLSTTLVDKIFRKLEKDLLRIEEVDEDEKTEDKSSSIVTSPDGNYYVTSLKGNIIPSRHILLLNIITCSCP